MSSSSLSSSVRTDENYFFDTFRNVTTNLFILVTTLIYFGYSAYYYFIAEGQQIAIVYFLLQFPLLAAYFLNRNGNFRLSDYVMVISVVLICSYSTIIFGHELYATVLYIILTIIIIIQSSSRIDTFVFVSIIFGSYIYSFFQLELNGPLHPELRFKYDTYINFGATLLGCMVFSRFYMQSLLENIKAKENYNLVLSQANNNLIEQNRIIEAQKNEMELFTAMASHDLKSPIRTISSYLGLMQNKMETADRSKLLEYLEYAQNGTSQLNQLIQGISEYKRIISTEVAISVVDLNNIIADVINILEIKANPNIVISDKTKSSLRANRTHIYHLVQNIIENGLKYNQSEIKELNIYEETTENYYILKIEDNGIGIQEEYRESIFEPFKKLHSDADYKSTGIGLSICKKIMDLYNGNIRTEANHKNGTTFVLEFPIKIWSKQKSPVKQSLSMVAS